MPQGLILIVIACVVSLGMSRNGVAAERTSVALTFTVSASAAEADRKLAENLVALIEIAVFADESQTFVERQQMSLALQELALSRSRTADESLQLGKLVTADVLVMLEFREADKESRKPTVLLRIVDAKTAAIRGVTAASGIEAATLEETAEQFSRYVSAVNHGPRAPTVTVAVAPFESVGRFDRLRPLELAIRDLVTSRLLSLSGVLRSLTLRVEPIAGKTRLGESSYVARFQVLQRSNMEQLLRELDLIQSGLSDKDRLPSTLPSRQASYLVRGEIDERQADNKFTVIVRAKLIHAATGKAHDSFEFESAPGELESQLVEHVDQFVARLEKQTVVIERAPLKQGVERESLKSLALGDLVRFRRQCPIDFSPREFHLPGDKSGQVLRLVQPETPLGQALLRKSIDRLEAALFLQPDDAEAAYALGFCYSLHQPETYRPDRADELLRKAAALKPQSQLALMSLALLPEIAFHDRTGKLADSETARQQTAERIWFAFEQTPKAFRDRRWPRMLELFQPLTLTVKQNAALMAKIVPYAEQAEDAHREELAHKVHDLALRLMLQAQSDRSIRVSGVRLLQHWSQSDDQLLANYGRIGLARILAQGENRDLLGAARLYEEAATKLVDLTVPGFRHKHDWQLIEAASNYRLAGQPDQALKLLLSFEAQPVPNSLSVGKQHFEIGLSHEALGNPKEALSAYISGAEECPSFANNSDVVSRIVKLGGVPVREDRDVDVRYLPLKLAEVPTALQPTPGPRNKVPPPQPLNLSKLATDGSRLFVGSSQGLYALALDGETWKLVKGNFGRVTCVKSRPGELWVGTKENGIWRCDLAFDTWTQIGTDEGLPDLHVESLTLHGDDVYIGSGTRTSGGLVRIDAQGKVHLINDPHAPRVAPTHVIVQGDRILARTQEKIHERAAGSETWTILPDEPHRMTPLSSRLFAGTTAIWASRYRYELTRWDADDAANRQFQPAWFVEPPNKAGILVEFIAEHGDEVWFGGYPWDTFISSGLYRFHRKTGAFHKFSPRDGFKAAQTSVVYDGLWVRDQLWLATSQGLCVVTPRVRD